MSVPPHGSLVNRQQLAQSVLASLLKKLFGMRLPPQPNHQPAGLGQISSDSRFRHPARSLQSCHSVASLVPGRTSPIADVDVVCLPESNPVFELVPALQTSSLRSLLWQRHLVAVMSPCTRTSRNRSRRSTRALPLHLILPEGCLPPSCLIRPCYVEGMGAQLTIWLIKIKPTSRFIGSICG